jgi:hypothetical protein
MKVGLSSTSAPMFLNDPNPPDFSYSLDFEHGDQSIYGVTFEARDWATACEVADNIQHFLDKYIREA